MPADKTTIFISYSADNLGLARILAELAQSAGLSVWFDRQSLLPGDDWSAMLKEALSNASLAVILVGSETESPYFQAEIEVLAARAKEQGAFRLFPVLMPGAGGDIPLSLREIQVLDLRETAGIVDRIARGIDKVKRVVGPLIERPDLIAMIYAILGKRLYALDQRTEAMILFDLALADIPKALTNKTNNEGNGLPSKLLGFLGILMPEEDTKPPLQQLIAFLGNWASEMHDRGDYEGARIAQQRLMELLGESDDPAALTLTNNLATTLRAEGRLNDAFRLEEYILAKRRLLLGNEHPDTLASMSNLASTLSAQGDFAGARALQESALAIRQSKLGEAHPDTLTAMNNLASTLKAQGDLAGARALEESALATRRRVLGEAHPDTLTAMNNLASTFYAQGDLAGARALQESVLVLQRGVQGEEHPDTLSLMNNLASTLWAQGDLAGARALEESALALRQRVLGEEHPDTLTSMNNLANTLWQLNEHEAALALMRAAAAGFERVLGAEHPHSVMTRKAAEAMQAALENSRNEPA